MELARAHEHRGQLFCLPTKVSNGRFTGLGNIIRAPPAMPRESSLIPGPPHFHFTGVGFDEKANGKLMRHLELAEGRHPQAWATALAEADNGCRLAIEAYKTVDGQERRTWLHSPTLYQSQVAIANPATQRPMGGGLHLSDLVH